MLESIVCYFSGENKLYNNVKGQIPSLTPGDAFRQVVTQTGTGNTIL